MRAGDGPSKARLWRRFQRQPATERLRGKRAPRILILRVFLIALLALAPASLPPCLTEGEPVAHASAPQRAADARAREAFAALKPSERRDVVDLLALKLEHSGTFQSSLQAWVKKRQDRDPAAWRKAEPPAIFDPAVLAPAQPTPRHWLGEDELSLSRARKALFARRLPRGLVPGYVYDYATRELVRQPSSDESARVFENALAGFPPELDLVEALIERELDDGSFAKEAAAFAHAYTDRVGGAYPGITLYDAYASGSEFEMPDVDVLGLLHVFFDDADRWQAPIPATAHPVIYPRISERFVPYQRHRTLRNALARSFAVGDAVLDDGFGGLLDNFHALWEDCESTPETLRARLPKPADRDAFLEAWVARCKGPDSPFPAGQRRRALLASEAQFVRSSVFDALRELGALENPVKKAKEAPR